MPFALSLAYRTAGLPGGVRREGGADPDGRHGELRGVRSRRVRPRPPLRHRPRGLHGALRRGHARLRPTLAQRQTLAARRRGRGRGRGRGHDDPEHREL